MILVALCSPRQLTSRQVVVVTFDDVPIEQRHFGDPKRLLDRQVLHLQGETFPFEIELWIDGRTDGRTTSQD